MILKILKNHIIILLKILVITLEKGAVKDRSQIYNEKQILILKEGQMENL